MGNALLEAAFVQRVNGRTTGLRCATTEKSRKKLIGSHRQTGLRDAKNPYSTAQYIQKSTSEVQNQIEDNFMKMSFYTMKKHRKKTLGFATLDIILPNRKGVHNLKAKVDTGAEGNTLTLRTFQQIFPECVDRNEQPLPGTTQTETTILTAYNGSNIPQHRSI